MTPDSRPATPGGHDRVADASVGHRQSSLSGVAADGVHQTTIAGAGPGSGRPDAPTVVNAFPLGDAVLVRHYFDSDEAFAVLGRYYDERAYRFEIPRDEFRAVRRELSALGYDLRPIDDVEAYAVAVRKYRAHPESVFSDAVAEFSDDGYNVFVLKDAAAVRAAVDDGAVRLADAPVTVRFPTGYGTGPLTVRDVS